MKKYFFLIIFVLLADALALEFSPPVLQFNLEQNQQECKSVFFKLDGETTISDYWSYDNLSDWSVTKLKNSSEEMQIDASYLKKIASDENEIQFCLSGAKPGNYRGALVFNQEKVGNSIVQFLVWIKLSVSEKNPQSGNENSSDSQRTESTRRSGGNAGIFESSDAKSPEQKYEFQPLAFEAPEKIKLGKSSKNVEVQNKINSVPLIFISFTLFFFLVIFLVLARNRKT